MVYLKFSGFFASFNNSICKHEIVVSYAINVIVTAKPVGVKLRAETVP